MTTLTIEWETTVIEKHRITIDPDHDGVPPGFDTIEQMHVAAVVDSGAANDDVPQARLDRLREWLTERELTPAKFHAVTGEDITDRTITTVHITQPAKDAA